MPDVYAAAHAKMKAALDDLDQAGAPADIGAHLDMAICRLEELLKGENHQIAIGAMETLAK